MSNYDLIVIGGSAGSILPLIQILSELPSDFGAALLVTIHINAAKPTNLPSVLSKKTELQVRYPESGERIIPGNVYVASPDLHLVVIDGHLLLRGGPEENRHRPAIDPLFRSAGQRHGEKTIGLLLSGTMDDGTAGMAEIKKHGGYGIVQDPTDAQFGSMPQSAIDHSQVDQILPTSEVANRLKELVKQDMKIVGKPFTKEPTINITDLEDILLHQITDQPGEVSDLGCPECGSALWEINQQGFIRYRCHIGHSFSANSLLEKQSETIETHYWQLLRILKERYELRKRLADNYKQQDMSDFATMIEKDIEVDKQRLDALERQLNLRQA